MKKLVLIGLVILCQNLLIGQDIIEVHYMERAPFFYHVNEKELAGIEYDILMSFKAWLKETQNKEVVFQFEAHSEFKELLTSVKKESKNTIGCGTVTFNEERAQYLKFAGPYLKNTSLLVSYPGKTSVSEDFLNTQSASVYVTGESVHEKSMMQYASLNTQLELLPVASQVEIPELIQKNKNAYGWMDLVFYWHLLKENPENGLQLHRSVMSNDESFHYITPKKSNWYKYLYVFFNDDFGFTATKEYHRILKNYLGEEVINYIEINP